MQPAPRIFKGSCSRLGGSIRVPGDKSIAHRVLMLAAVADGESRLTGLPRNDDIRATIHGLRALGVRMHHQGDDIRIMGCSSRRFDSPTQPLDCGGSASTMRMLLGLVCGRGGEAIFDGDPSLRARPMDRVAQPLEAMGARFSYLEQPGRAPLRIQAPERPRALDFALAVPSAQVKTAMILAALFADGPSIIRGRIDSRDHTERLLPLFGGQIACSEDALVVTPGPLRACNLEVPGDPSSAAFFLAAAALIPGSQVCVEGVSANPSRCGFQELLARIGAPLELRLRDPLAPEPVADLTVAFADLSSFTVSAAQIPYLVDEIPLIALVATQARGHSVIQGIHEARLKETDRVAGSLEELGRMGARISVIGDDLHIEGPTPLVGAALDARGDHRLAMMLSLAALMARGESSLTGWDCVSKSFPGFFQVLDYLLAPSACERGPGLA
jgi:3-phosphoshikimate 1-carboxyvinyltransferase